MKYFLDSVKKNEIEESISFIDGVTSNPILLKQANINKYDFLEIMKPYTITRFVQVTKFEEAEEVANRFKNDLNFIVFKVTMHPKFYNEIEKIKREGWKIAATTIYDIIQINQAIEMRLDYTMVYKAKNEYPHLFSDAYKLKKINNSNIELVGASFRTKNEIKDAILEGMNFATLPFSVLQKTFINEQLNRDIHDLYE